jgi:hypothetical protein
MHVRQGEQELGAPRMAELRELGAEIVDRQAEGVDDVLVLGPGDCANGLGDPSARTRTLGGNTHQVELKLWKRASAPAEVGPRVEDAEA